MLWTIPTFGLLISSFRPEDDVKTSGWWTFFTNPAFTLDNYERGALGGGDTEPRDATSSTRSSSRSRRCSSRSRSRAGGVRVRLDQVPGPRLAVRRGLRAADRADPGDPDPAAHALRGPAVRPARWPASTRRAAASARSGSSHTIFALPLAIFLLHNFMTEMPGELIEAARVDGAGHVQIFRRIMLPLMTPAHRGVRHLPVPLGLERPAGGAGLRRRQPDVSPLTVRLAELAGTRGNDWHLLSAGAFVSLIVPLIVFLSPAALLRPRPARRQRQGLSPAPPPPVAGRRRPGAERGTVTSIKDVARAVGRVDRDRVARAARAAAGLRRDARPGAAGRRGAGLRRLAERGRPRERADPRGRRGRAVRDALVLRARSSQGAEELLREAGYDLLLYNLGGDREARHRVFRSHLLRKRVDAVLVLSLTPTDEEVRGAGQAGPAGRRGRRHGARLVERAASTTWRPRGSRCGTCSTWGTAGSATSAGRWRTSWTSPPRWTGCSGYRERDGAGRPRGRPVAGRWSATSPSAAGWRRPRLLLEADPRPTAVFAASDEMAVGAVHAAARGRPAGARGRLGDRHRRPRDGRVLRAHHGGPAGARAGPAGRPPAARGARRRPGRRRRTRGRSPCRPDSS